MKKARARREELSTAELDGKKFRAEDIQVWANDVVYSVKGALMALPSRVAVAVAGESDPAACAYIVKKEVRDILTELSEYHYNPEFYQERIRERQQMELKFMTDDEEEAAL